MSYQNEIILDLTKELLAQGYRVFLAEKGTYGFYTNNEGKRIVSFACDLGGINFSGNYKSKTDGTGWRIGRNREDYEVMLNEYPWVGIKFEKFTTVEEHLAIYNSSSRYTELKG
jgi:hypothetical protein